VVVVLLTTAVQQRRQVYLRYEAFGGAETERDFDPYGVVYYEGYWYAAGYCHLRHDLRTFRLDRVRALKPLDSPFEPPDDFDALEHVRASLQSMGAIDPVEVLLETTLEHAREHLPDYVGTLEPTDGGVIFRLGGVPVEWVVLPLLLLDVPITIVQGDRLRQLIHAVGQRARQITGAS
jgi:predicted DNA-binding transcriptional regulator YafY